MIGDSYVPTIFRIYGPEELAKDGYPHAWRSGIIRDGDGLLHRVYDKGPSIGVKDLVRLDAGHRCLRCGHPYIVGESSVWDTAPPDSPMAHEGEDQSAALQAEIGRLFYSEADDRPPDALRNQAINWSQCDNQCTHAGPCRAREPGGEWRSVEIERVLDRELWLREGHELQAAWRILTVHHLNERKHDLRWWNLAALCQRCHLVIQRKVKMDRSWPWEHTEWFKPFAAAHYAYKYQGVELAPGNAMADLDRLLDMGKRLESAERMPV